PQNPKPLIQENLFIYIILKYIRIKFINNRMSDLDSEDGVVKKMAKWKLYTIMLFMLAFVTYNTLIAKAMDEFEVGEVYDHDKKKHVPAAMYSTPTGANWKSATVAKSPTSWPRLN
ncbi:MAG: hypothetical protein ACKO96_28160, partial [Flammeovirgaceae bacterium]